MVLSRLTKLCHVLILSFYDWVIYMVHHNLFIHSSVGGTFWSCEKCSCKHSCLWFCVNICLHFSGGDRQEIVGSFGNSVHLFEKPLTLPQWLHHLTFSPVIHKDFNFSSSWILVFLMATILLSVKLHLLMGLNCNSLMVSDNIFWSAYWLCVYIFSFGIRSIQVLYLGFDCIYHFVYTC